MAKRRFRKVKQGKLDEAKESPKKKTSVSSTRSGRPYASAGLKMKAFLTDSFMLLMPVMYAVIYLVMGGLPNVAKHRLETWIYILVPFILIQTIFMYKAGQTPGYKAYDLEVIDEATGERPPFWQLLFRNVAALLSALTLVGWTGMFFRKDKKNLHDFLSNTAVVEKR
jgi:uncharacterized RDD family membrane protein YckC